MLKLVENIGWLAFDKMIRLCVGVILVAWVARYLEPKQFGLLNFATAFVGLFSAIAPLGLKSIVVRDIVVDPSCREETLGTAAVLQFLAGLFIFGGIVGAIFWFRPDEPVVKLLVAILGSTVLLRFSDVALYWFESQVLSKYVLWVQNGCFLIFAAIKVWLIMSEADLLAFAWATTLEVLIVALLLLVVLSSHGLKLQRLRFSLLRARTLLLDSWPLLLGAIAVTAQLKIDQIMLSKMMTDEAVGIYSVAVRMSELWYFIPMIIVASVFPAILEAKKRGGEQYLRRLQALYSLMTLLSFAISVPMTFISTHIVVALFGLAYFESGQVLAIHIWTSIFVFMGVASNQWFAAENRQILGFQRAVLGAIINIALNYALIPEYGVIGAAFATLLAQISVNLVLDVLQRETYPLFLIKLKSLNPVHIVGAVQ